MNMNLNEKLKNVLDILPQCSSSNTQEPIQAYSLPSSHQIAVEFPYQYKNFVTEFKTEVESCTQLFEMNPAVHNLHEQNSQK